MRIFVKNKGKKSASQYELDANKNTMKNYDT